MQLVYSIQYFGYSLAQLSQLIQLRRSLYTVAAYSQLIRLEYKGRRHCQILDNPVNSLCQGVNPNILSCILYTVRKHTNIHFVK